MEQNKLKELNERLINRDFTYSNYIWYKPAKTVEYITVTFRMTSNGLEIENEKH